MFTSEPLLKMSLLGPEIEAGRMPVDALILVLNRIQVCVKRLGQELSGEESSAGSGRLKAPVEAACRLEVVALVSGSFVVGLDVPTESLRDDLLPAGDHLGRRAVETLVQGLEGLTSESSYLVGEFGYGVLRALNDMGKVFSRGVSRIEFELKCDKDRPRKATYDLITRDLVLKHLEGPTIGAARVRGGLREVNLARGSCQLFPPSGKPIDCTFDDPLEPVVRQSLGHYVVASGEAERIKQTGRIQRMRLQEIAILDRSAYEPADLLKTVSSSARDVLQSLRQSGVVGMWRDRKDIDDSSEFAAKLRRRMEKELEEE